MKEKMLTAALAILLATAQQSSAATIVISDTEFNSTDYAIQTDGSGANTSFSSTGTQIPIGGAPGAFRQVTNNAVGRFGNSDTERVLGWHFNTTLPYDPSTGEILSIDYSEDSLLVFGSPHEGRLALRQNGILYRTEASFTTGASNTVFSSNSFDDLTAADFEGFFNGVFFPTADPDFSTTGSPIEFGFLRSFVSNQNFNTASGIDNWTVELTTEIPEPATLSLLLGLASALLVVRKR